MIRMEMISPQSISIAKRKKQVQGTEGIAWAEDKELRTLVSWAIRSAPITLDKSYVLSIDQKPSNKITSCVRLKNLP